MIAAVDSRKPGLKKQFTSNHHNDLHNPMSTHCQFTVKRSEKRVVLTVAAEQQPCGVQVVERVGLVASGFQFLPRLAAVFAEEVGGFGILDLDGQI